MKKKLKTISLIIIVFLLLVNNNRSNCQIDPTLSINLESKNISLENEADSVPSWLAKLKESQEKQKARKKA